MKEEDKITIPYKQQRGIKLPYDGYRNYRISGYCFFDQISEDESVETMMKSSIFASPSKSSMPGIKVITILKKNEEDNFVMIVQPLRRGFKKALEKRSIKCEIDQVRQLGQSKTSVYLEGLIIYLQDKQQMDQVISLIKINAKLPEYMKKQFVEMCNSLNRFFSIKELIKQPKEVILKRLTDDIDSFLDDAKEKFWSDLCFEMSKNSDKKDLSESIKKTLSRASKARERKLFAALKEEFSSSSNSESEDDAEEDEFHSPSNSGDEQSTHKTQVLY